MTIPQLANSFGSKDFKRFKKMVSFTFLLNLILSVLPATLLFFFCGIFQNFYGSEFNLNTSLILVVLITGILIALTNSIGYIFICSNLIWIDFILRIFWGIALLVLIFLYGRYNGAIGYAYSILGASLIHLIAQGFVLLAKIKFNSN